MDFQLIELDGMRNNYAITKDSGRGGGGFNVWRNSLPAAEVPDGHMVVEGVPFQFPRVGNDHPDNVRAAGQVIEVPRDRYDWIYLLAAAERRVEDELTLCFADTTCDFEPLRLSDFWAAPPVFGETPAVVTATMQYPHHRQAGLAGTIWCQRVPVVRRADLIGVRLPANMAVHVFAMTGQRSRRLPI